MICTTSLDQYSHVKTDNINKNIMVNKKLAPNKINNGCIVKKTLNGNIINLILNREIVDKNNVATKYGIRTKRMKGMTQVLDLRHKHSGQIQVMFTIQGLQKKTYNSKSLISFSCIYLKEEN